MAPGEKDWEISSSERAEHQNEPLVFPENMTKAMITSKATTFTILTPSPMLKISLMPYIITSCIYNKHANLSIKSICPLKPQFTWCAFSVENKKRKSAASLQCPVTTVVCKLMWWGSLREQERGELGLGTTKPSGLLKNTRLMPFY